MAHCVSIPSLAAFCFYIRRFFNVEPLDNLHAIHHHVSLVHCRGHQIKGSE